RRQHLRGDVCHRPGAADRHGPAHDQAGAAQAGAARAGAVGAEPGDAGAADQPADQPGAKRDHRDRPRPEASAATSRPGIRGAIPGVVLSVLGPIAAGRHASSRGRRAARLRPPVLMVLLPGCGPAGSRRLAGGLGAPDPVPGGPPWGRSVVGLSGAGRPAGERSVGGATEGRGDRERATDGSSARPEPAKDGVHGIGSPGDDSPGGAEDGLLGEADGCPTGDFGCGLGSTAWSGAAALAVREAGPAAEPGASPTREPGAWTGPGVSSSDTAVPAGAPIPAGTAVPAGTAEPVGAAVLAGAAERGSDPPVGSSDGGRGGSWSRPRYHVGRCGPGRAGWLAAPAPDVLAGLVFRTVVPSAAESASAVGVTAVGRSSGGPSGSAVDAPGPVDAGGCGRLRRPCSVSSPSSADAAGRGPRPSGSARSMARSAGGSSTAVAAAARTGAEVAADAPGWDRGTAARASPWSG